MQLMNETYIQEVSTGFTTHGTEIQYVAKLCADTVDFQKCSVTLVGFSHFTTDTENVIKDSVKKEKKCADLEAWIGEQHPKF